MQFSLSVFERAVQPAWQDQPIRQGQLQREGAQRAAQVESWTKICLPVFQITRAVFFRLDFNGFYTTAIDQFKADTG